MMDNKMQEYLNFVRANISKASRYEALAEEAAELAQASLKVARVLRGENPTPVTLDEAMQDLEEEYADVELCAEAAMVRFRSDINRNKLIRWKRRIEGKAE